jgi:hypothetical protein
MFAGNVTVHLDEWNDSGKKKKVRDAALLAHPCATFQSTLLLLPFVEAPLWLLSYSSEPRA